MCYLGHKTIFKKHCLCKKKKSKVNSSRVVCRLSPHSSVSSPRCSRQLHRTALGLTVNTLLGFTACSRTFSQHAAMLRVCKLQGTTHRVWIDRRSLATYGCLAAAGGRRRGCWITSNTSDRREGVKFWHEDPFQFTSCWIQGSRTEGKGTKTCLVAGMFLDTHTHVRTHIYSANDTSTSTHTHTHLGPFTLLLTARVHFYQMKLNVLRQLEYKCFRNTWELLKVPENF